MSIAAFVDLTGDQRDLATELTIALAEFCMAQHEPLFLLADAVTALEVGVSLMGSRSSRTVEGGDFSASPLTLLPLIPRPDTVEDQLLRSAAESDSGGELEELFALGLFARPVERKAEFGDQPFQALVDVIAKENPKRILGLGPSSEYWQAINEGVKLSEGTYVPEVILVEGFSADVSGGELARVLVSRPELASIRRPEGYTPPKDEAFESTRRQAEQDGALIAGLWNYLSGHSSRH